MTKPPESNAAAMLDRHMGCLTIICLVPAIIFSSHLMFRLAQFLYIRAAFGRAAWESGLRVVDKQGHLSNGAELSAMGHVVVDLGGGLLTAMVFVGIGLGLPYLRMRLCGERLSEQLDRWKSGQ